MMMNSPNCPDHGRLVLDLALGRLDDGASVTAESLSESCPVCREWWREQFDSDAAATVDKAVAATFSDLRLPARRRGYGWMAAAAAVVMSLGVGSIWMLQGPTNLGDEVAAPRVASIRTITFEPSDAAAEFILIEAPDPEPDPVERQTTQEPLAGEILVAEAAPAEAAVDRSSGVVFAGGFETGDLGGWVPST
jgi:hypothetical protein